MQLSLLYFVQSHDVTIYLAFRPHLREKGKHLHGKEDNDECVEGRGKTRRQTHRSKDGSIERDGT